MTVFRPGHNGNRQLETGNRKSAIGNRNFFPLASRLRFVNFAHSRSRLYGRMWNTNAGLGLGGARRPGSHEKGTLQPTGTDIPRRAPYPRPDLFQQP